jgi:(4S)-4-hydroxy-5-phosphonooxypentane-2,3-dione isomerase
MHILHIHLKIKPEHIDEFIAASVGNAQSSLREAGCVRFDVVQDTAEPSHFEFIEIYRDQAAHAAHRESAHYKAWAGRVEGMMAEPRSRILYRNIFPQDDVF